MTSPLRSAFQAMRLNADAVRAIYQDQSTVHREVIGTIVAALLMAVCFGALLGLLGYVFPTTFGAFSPWTWFWIGAGAGLVFALFLFAVSIGATHLFAKWLGGTGTIGQFIAAFVWTSVPLQLIALISLLTLFTPLGTPIQIAVTLYSLIVQVFVVRVVYSLSWIRAAIASLLPLVILFVLLVLLFLALAAWGLIAGVQAFSAFLASV